MINLFKHLKLLAVVIFLCSLKHLILLLYIYIKHEVIYWANDAFIDIFWGSFWLYSALAIRSLIGKIFEGGDKFKKSKR